MEVAAVAILGGLIGLGDQDAQQTLGALKGLDWR